MPLHPWKWPTRPFKRVHVDFCQKGKDYFLVLIDSHSKWIDVKHMTSTTTERTIDELRLIFAEHGLPEQLVSVNGPQFTSAEFALFIRQNGIKHTLAPPYHPASNGAAERSVRVVTEALEKQVLQGTGHMSMKHRLANFLIKYRSTPHSVTGRTPAELMVKRQLRTRLTLLKPNLAQVFESKQMKQKFHHDRSQVERTFKVNEPVRVRNPVSGFKSGSVKWSPGIVSKVCGRRWYLVQVGSSTRHVHADHLITASGDETSTDPSDSLELESHLRGSQNVFEPELCTHDVQDGRAVILPEPETENTEVTGGVPTQEQENTEPTGSSAIPTEGLTLRRSTRIRKPVEKLNL